MSAPDIVSRLREAAATGEVSAQLLMEAASTIESQQKSLVIAIDSQIGRSFYIGMALAHPETAVAKITALFEAIGKTKQ